MLDVTLLGTGGMAPLPGRLLTAMLARYQGVGILVDCGEGTQIALREAGSGFKQIGIICLTHFHADHMAGLPGLLLTIGNSGRAEPLTIIGPKHVRQVVECLRVIAPQLPYPVEYQEIPQGGGEQQVYRIGDLTISAQPVEHWIPCYAWRLDLSRRPKFQADKAKALGIPVNLWKTLQQGEPVEHEGRLVQPSAVTGEARRGIRLCYSTDLRPGDGLVSFAEGADLWICEGMYGDPEALDKAREHRHCLFTEAADMGKRAAVEELWLTHFSPSLTDPEAFLPGAQAIFPNTWVHKRRTTLAFRD